MRKFNVGILGCGVISRTYAADIQAFYPCLNIAACADVQKEAAQKLAVEFHIPAAYTPEELLRDKTIEIVIDLTPPQLHVELNRQILQAGKHLFSEKPFAQTAREAEELVRRPDRKTVFRYGEYDELRAGDLASESRALLPERGRTAVRYGALLPFRPCRAARARRKRLRLRRKAA